MKLKSAIRWLAVWSALALMLPHSVNAQSASWTGAAQIPFPGGNDFAMCDPAMPSCDATTNDCCVRQFAPVATDRAIIIPMDRCHQTPTGSAFIAPPSGSPAWCSDPSAVQDDGMWHAYGLVYRLMQQGIPVHWIVNPTKDPTTVSTTQSPVASQVYTDRNIDAWILGYNTSTSSAYANPPVIGDALTNCGAGCESPVVKLNSTTLLAVTSYSKAQFPIKGSAFLIAAEDRAKFNEFFLKKPPNYNSLIGNPLYDWSDIDMYELGPNAKIVWQDYRSTTGAYALIDGAPIAARIDYPPPHLARQSPAGPSNLWLAKAKLNEPAAVGCAGGTWTPSTAVYCDVTEAQISNGALRNGFHWAWIDNINDNNPCNTAQENAFMSEVHYFLEPDAAAGREAGAILFQEGVIKRTEGCSSREFMGVSGDGLSTDNAAMSEPFILRYPSNLFMQFGDMTPRFAQGNVAKMSYFGGGATGFSASLLGATGSLRRLVTEDNSGGAGNVACTGHKSTPACDIFANDANADVTDLAIYTKKDGNDDNGIVFYMGGNQVNQNNNAAHLRMVLNALIAMPLGISFRDASITEVSRSSPIVVSTGGTLAMHQGTFERRNPAPAPTTYSGAGDNASYIFPHTVGHLRAIDASALGATETDFTDLGAGDVLWDAGERIPPPSASGCGAQAFTGACRTVFFNRLNGAVQERVEFSTANNTILAPLVSGGIIGTADLGFFVERVLSGHRDPATNNLIPKLGGIDRSTMAIVEASPIAGATRPAMIYVGATDGMLHAICADGAVAPCSQGGQELWAFVPRVNLPGLRTNSARIDGSPKVADIFMDMGGGLMEWRTILTFQTGSGDPSRPLQSPAVYALDITNPVDPKILWEYKTPATRGSFELGRGLGIAMGPVKDGAGIKNLTFVTTNNGGTGPAGMLLLAIDTPTGVVVWRKEYPYPAPRSNSNPSVPATGIPGGPAAIDKTNTGSLTHLLVGTLYGELWMLDARTGEPAHRDTSNNPIPMVRFATDFHPVGATPTIYRDRSTGLLGALVVSGGYADPFNSSWAPATVNQYAIGVSINLPYTSWVDETNPSSNFGGRRQLLIDLGAGNRAFAQAVVSGNELFIVTDSGDVNASTYGGSATGSLRRFSLSGGAEIGSATTLAGGAAGPDVSAGIVYSGAGKAAAKTDVSATHDSNGGRVELQPTTGTGRELWLRTQ